MRPHLVPFRWLVCLALPGTLMAWSAFAARHAPPAHAPLPRDASAYIQRRDLCDHFRGEYPAPSETTRMAEVVHALDRYCPGSDARLAALKARYRDNKTVQAALAGYEPHIEP